MGIPGSANPLLITAPVEEEFKIERSVRFNSADSAFLSRTPASAGNRKTWTWAGWVKLAKTSFNNLIECVGPTTPGTRTSFLISDLGKIDFFTDNTSSSRITTTQVFRDFSAWYHIVLAIDTTEATASNRVKLYINGSQVTTFSTATYPSQNLDTQVNNTQLHTIGKVYDPFYANMYLADVHLIDGQALAPTSFGFFDDNGIWQPKAFEGVYGTNGFYLPFSDNSSSSALGTDFSGNNNNWNVNNLFTRSVKTLDAVAFDGSGDYLSLSDSDDFELGSGDFTIEFYINSTQSQNSFYTAVSKWSNSNFSWMVRYSSIDIGTGWSFFYSSTGNSFTTVFGQAINDGGWHHIAVTRSGTTIRTFTDGVQNNSRTTSDTFYNGTADVNVGADRNAQFFKGFISNLRIVKGTALYTSNFTPPSAPLTAVTNTKLLCCQSSSSATAATVSPGAITANGDVFATTRSDSSPDEDSLVDVPENGAETDTGVGGEVRGNYCTWNPISNGAGALSNGNLQLGGIGGAGTGRCNGTIAVSSGKWYFESTLSTAASFTNVGIGQGDITNQFPGQDALSYAFTCEQAIRINNNSQPSYGVSLTTGDILMVAFDLDNSKIFFGKNGIWMASSDPATGANPAFTLASGTYKPIARPYDTSGVINVNFGQRPFAYTAPSGFKALNTANLPAPTIPDGSDYFDVKLYTGNGSTQTISGLEFSPDLVWYKQRDQARFHRLYDTVRGATNALRSDSTNAEEVISGLTSFTSDGFVVGSDFGGNQASGSYVAWTWDAGSSAVTNTQGSITSTVRANPSAGFSIITYTGDGSTSATVGHGLGTAPVFYVGKNRSDSGNWLVLTTATGSMRFGFLNLTNSFGAPTQSAPTSSVINILSAGFETTNGNDYVIYAFAPVEGYSSIGSYVGNGSTDGPFIYTGHRSRWLLVKSNSTTGDWVILDAERDTANGVANFLRPNLSDVEGNAGGLVDFCSNGFKLRNTFGNYNTNGTTYIYIAFAENPFSIARAR